MPLRGVVLNTQGSMGSKMGMFSWWERNGHRWDSSIDGSMGRRCTAARKRCECAEWLGWGVITEAKASETKHVGPQRGKTNISHLQACVEAIPLPTMPFAASPDSPLWEADFTGNKPLSRLLKHFVPHPSALSR